MFFFFKFSEKFTACNHRLPNVKADVVGSKIMYDDGTRFPSPNKVCTVVLCLSWELVERNHHNHHTHPHNHHHTDPLLHVHHDHLDHHGLHDLLPLLEARI